MRVVAPRVTVLNSEGYRIAIAHYPLTDEGDQIRRIRETMLLSSCEEPLLCYPLLYGGIVVFHGHKAVWRGEYDGYFKIDEGPCDSDILDFMSKVDRGEDACLKTEEGTLSLRAKCDSCIKVDQVGLRMIVD
ncbi:hypothetical protein [Metallosphaera hakonensis]|uniref:Uncharacterized protein n=1 Tax=Metallosphaera hakonensis JCM 8857 = DSM 7519 TaxID=1293036 RepID=A0A2U9IS38_9CREN|nr:hypothetical protein [Metallosphaera hakonensis]AWR98807.1 hypothetical protein DFR87_02880 [Metallosphaera hakonensis JCM 8857 = DSM 7519]